MNTGPSNPNRKGGAATWIKEHGVVSALIGAVVGLLAIIVPLLLNKVPVPEPKCRPGAKCVDETKICERPRRCVETIDCGSCPSDRSCCKELSKAQKEIAQLRAEVAKLKSLLSCEHKGVLKLTAGFGHPHPTLMVGNIQYPIIGGNPWWPSTITEKVRLGPKTRGSLADDGNYYLNFCSIKHCNHCKTMFQVRYGLNTDKSFEHHIAVLSGAQLQKIQLSPKHPQIKPCK